MPKTLFEPPRPTPHTRILSLEGGSQGLLTLGMLKPLEDTLRARAGGGRNLASAINGATSRGRDAATVDATLSNAENSSLPESSLIRPNVEPPVGIEPTTYALRDSSRGCTEVCGGASTCLRPAAKCIGVQGCAARLLPALLPPMPSRSAQFWPAPAIGAAGPTQPGPGQIHPLLLGAVNFALGIICVKGRCRRFTGLSESPDALEEAFVLTADLCPPFPVARLGRRSLCSQASRRQTSAFGSGARIQNLAGLAHPDWDSSVTRGSSCGGQQTRASAR